MCCSRDLLLSVDLLPGQDGTSSAEGTACVSEYLRGSPEVSEVMRLLEGDKVMRDSGKITSSLRLLAALLALGTHPQLHKASKGLGTKVLRR